MSETSLETKLAKYILVHGMTEDTTDQDLNSMVSQLKSPKGNELITIIWELFMQEVGGLVSAMLTKEVLSTTLLSALTNEFEKYLEMKADERDKFIAENSLVNQ